MKTGYIFRPLAAFLVSGTLLAAQSSTNSQPVQKAKASDLVKAGQKLNSEGNQDQAVALYRQALQLSPNLFEAHLATGVALDLKGEYEEAHQHLGKAIELAPPEAKVQALRTTAISYAFESNASEAASSNSKRSMPKMRSKTLKAPRAQPTNLRAFISNPETWMPPISGTRPDMQRRCASPI